MSSQQEQIQQNSLIFTATCQTCGILKPGFEFYDPTTLSFSNFCQACRINFVKMAAIKDSQPDKEVPEHMLSRAFKIKHYFVGLKVVPQSRWIAVPNNFKCSGKNCITAKSITHRTLLKEQYMR